MKDKGITLLSLVIYIGVMMIVLTTMSVILLQFQENNNELKQDTDDILQLSSFNTYFLKEIKLPGNKVDTIKDNYILFKSGNYFSKENDKISYSGVKICNGVQSIVFSKNEQNNDIITVNIRFKDFSKILNYKVEEIY